MMMAAAAAHHHSVRQAVRILVMRVRMHLGVEVVASGMTSAACTSASAHIAEAGVVERVVQLILVYFWPGRATIEAFSRIGIHFEY